MREASPPRNVAIMWRRLSTAQLGVDILIAAGFFLLLFLSTWQLGNGALFVLAGFSLALGFRRLAPGLALAIGWAVAIIQMWIGVLPNPANVAVFVLVYTAAAYGGSVARWTALASSFVAPATITLYVLADEGFGQLDMCLTFQYRYCATYVPDLAGRAVGWFVAFAFAFLLAWTIGQLVRTRHRARVNRAARIVAEQEVASEQERTRIARDMHDVVAHSLAVVIAQADGARYAQGREAAAAERALATISTTARAALSDVRMLLTQLRSTEAEGPQPQLADLEQLYAQVRTAGVELRVDVDPAPPPDAPAAVQLAVYRILQEALTNALRHGRGAVDIGLAWQADRVDLLVRNPVGPHAHDDAQTLRRGHGVIGMRERAQLVGGTLSATAESGVFVVRATLPMGAS